MTLLLVGGTGQVGRAFQAQADAAGISIAAPGRDVLDLTRAVDCAEVLNEVKPEAVVNAAAYTAVDRAESEHDAAFAANRDGPGDLAEACRAAGVPLIHLSTDYVFDGTKAGAYAETDPTGPRGVYAASKEAGEGAVRDRLDRHAILRTSWVFGVHGHNFPKTILRLAAERPVLTIVDDQHGCPTPAEAIAAALHQLIVEIRHRSAAFPWGTYHFAGQPPTTWHGFAREIVARAVPLGLIPSAPEIQPIPTEAYPTPAPRPANSVLDCSKWWATFDHPLPDWRAGLGAMLRALAQPSN